MNIFLYELKAHRKSTVIWIFSILLLCVLFLSLYPTYSSNADEVKTLFAGFPPTLLSVLGIDIDIFFSVVGFYSFLFMYIVLCGSIQGMNLGLSMTSKEGRCKTSDFLLTKPISRCKILTNKLLATLVLLIITNIVYIIVSSGMCLYLGSSTSELKTIFMISISMLFVQIIFASLGIFIGVVVKKIKNVSPISLAIVFTFLIIDMVGSAVSEDAVKYISPFKYFNTTHIINNSAYDMKFVILSFIIVAVFIIGSYVIYTKQDIHAV